MRGSGWAVLCAVGALAWAGSAGAVTYYDVKLTGTITSQGPGPDDANLHVGDTLTLTARLTDRFMASYGPGYQVLAAFADVGFGFPGDPGIFWSISGGGLSWDRRDDENDGHYPWFTYVNPDEHGDQSVDRALAGPALLIHDGHIVGFGEDVPLSPYFPTAPSLLLGPIGEVGGGFTLRNLGLYANNRYTPGFTGVWDYAGSTLTIEGIPEPSTWAVMLAGFFGLGAALRRRRMAPAAL